MPAKKTLSERERHFVDAFCGSAKGNRTQAAKDAGYSAKSAARIGTRLSKKVHVKAEIATRQATRADQSGITQGRVLDETALLAFSDLTHYTVSESGDVALAKEAPVGAMRALQSIKRRITTRGSGETAEVTREVELRLWDKVAPLKLAGQHVGLFVEKREVSGKITTINETSLNRLTDDDLRALAAIGDKILATDG